MKNPRSLRLALSRSLLVSSLLASSAFALTSAEFDSLRAKADRGNAIAQYNLGLAYSDRREPNYDPAQAYAWLSLAAAKGTNGKALANLTSLLTPEQLAEGKRRLAALTASPVSPVATATSPLASATEPVSPVAVASALSAPGAPAITADADPDQKKLSAELAAAWKENALIKSGLNAQLADANKRVAIAEAALASKDKQIAALQSSLTAAAASPAPAAAPIGVSAELASLRTERDQLQASLNTATTELTTLRASAAKAAADIALAQRTQALAEAESASLKAAADRASAERLAVAAQLETVTNELAAAKAAASSKPATSLSETGITVLKAERDTLAASVKTLTDERDALTAQLAAAKAAVPSAPSPSIALAPTPPAPESATPPAPDANAEASAKLADLEKAKSETDAKLAAALRSFTLQQAEIDRLQKALASIDNERAATAAKLDTANTELTALRPQAASAATLSTEAQALRTQLAAANQSLTEKSAALAASDQSLADSRKTIDTATAELVTTRDQLRQTQAQSAAFAVENQQLKTRLALVGSLPSSTAPTRPALSAPGSAAVLGGSVSVTLPPEPAAPSTPPPAGPRIHTVLSGDSLSRISKQYYGTAARWNDILQANKAVITNPDALTLGTKLRIP